MHSTYPTVLEYAVQQLITFVITWLCKAGFSAMSVLKTKHQNRLDVKSRLRLCFSKPSHDFKKLVEIKQVH